MRRAFDTALSHWLAVALAASLAILAIVHGFETFGRLPPCALCLKEREVYWVAAALAAAGLLIARARPGRRRLACGLLAVVFLFGAGLAAYHAGAEWKFWPGPASCSGGAGRVSPADIAELLGGGHVAPSCETPAWVFLGLSMAGWNVLVSLILASLSAAAARRRTAP
ncbi:MAG: disulfide bond formation protein B [Caulobacteraceae bacterium]